MGESVKDNKIIGRVFENSRPARGYVLKELIMRQWISMSSAMLRKSALISLITDQANAGKYFDERLSVCEEADVFYQIAHDFKLDYVDSPLTMWRIHAQNTTFTKYGLFAKETRFILEKLKTKYQDFENSYQEACEFMVMRASFQEAIDLWHNGAGSKARALIRPFVSKSLKFKLFWLCSFLPGSLFDVLARIYFALPAFIRR